jgi:dihydrofolate reductase
MSLDGFAAGPNGEMNWIRMEDEVFNFVDGFIGESDAGLYGPKTFQMMESYWPGVLNNSEARGHHLNHAKWYEKADKIVFSQKLKSLENKKAKLVPQVLASEIEELKKQPGKNLMIFGSPRLVQSFLQQGLIDEFIININPVILGAGISLFKNIDKKVELQLLKSTRFECGVLGCHYQRL